MKASTRKLWLSLLGLLVVAALVVGAGVWWVNQQVAGEPGEGDPVEVTVEEGASASSIGQALADNDVIRNALAFRLIVRTRGIGADFSSGVYQLETGMSVDEAIEALGAGPARPEVARVTIPEGWTVEQTLDRLAENTQFEVDEFRTVLDETRTDREAGPLDVPDWVPSFDEFTEDQEVFEGLLFPQTYEFDDDATATDILQTLLNETEVAMASVPPSAVSEAEEAGIDRYDALIAASLIEREARVPGEWAEIAAVIRNRLDEGMRLQIDATLLYAAGTPGAGPEAVDREVESPYNTYQNDGLPPTPISGARVEAIRAVFEPASTDYLYYVVAPECDGSHRFAETNEEHNENVQAYRDADRCQ